MKKRILSMLLAIVTVVAMIPAALVTALAETTATTDQSYGIFVSTVEPKFDGAKDDIYNRSDKIVNYKSIVGLGFSAYALMTTKGFYLYADVADTTVDKTAEAGSTNINNGDKFQIYLQVSNKVGSTTKWISGYFDLDYAHNAISASKGFEGLSNRQDLHKCVVKTDGSGYSVEFFMPWQDCKNALGIPNITSDTFKIYLGLQVNDTSKDTIFDSDVSNKFWNDVYVNSSNTEPTTKMNPTKLIFAHSDGYDVFVSDIDPTLDGKLDNLYTKSEKIINTAGEIHTGYNTSFEAYVVITDKGFYMFADVKDTTVSKDDELYVDPNAAEKQKQIPRNGDKTSLFLQVSNTVAGNTQWAWGYFDMDYAFAESAVDDTRIEKTGNFSSSTPKISTTTKQGTGYTIEFFMPWENCASSCIKTSITTETVDVYFGVQVNDHSGNDAGHDHGHLYDNTECGSYYHGKSYDKAYESITLGGDPPNKMIPANLFKATNGHYYGYDVYISDTEPVLDGNMDSVYKQSEKIVSSYIHVEGVTFEAYVVVTYTGLYMFADVKDTTMNDTATAAVHGGDKLQFYIQLGNTNSNGETKWLFDYFEMDYVHDTARVPYALNGSENTVKSVTTPGKGYTIEFFVSWAECAEHAKANGNNEEIFKNQVITPETVHFNFGIQVNNSNRENESSGENKELGLAFDNNKTIDYWNGTYTVKNGNAPTKTMIPAKLFSVGTVGYLDGYDTIVASPAEITFDGNRDPIYLNSEKIIPNYYITRSGIRLTDVDFEAYPVITEEGLYVWADIKDSTVNIAQESAVGIKYNDKMQIALQVVSGNTYKWGFMDFDYANSGVDGNADFDEANSACNPKKITNITDTGWTAEFFISWEDAGLATSDLNDISVYIGIQVNNGNAGSENNVNFGQAYDNPEAQNYYQSQYYSAANNTSNKRYIKLNYIYSGNQPLDSGVASIPAFSVYQLGAGEAVEVNGIRDDIYLNSQKISDKAVTVNGNVVDSADTGFDAYFVASTEGLYFYAEVEDPTAGKADDKIRLYLTDDPNQHAKSTNSSTGVANSVNATQTFTYLEIKADNTKASEGFISSNFENVVTKTKKLINASGKAYAWTVEAFIPWSSMANYSEEIADTTLNAPYYCSVGISAHNGSNVSYSNERRYDWAEAEAKKAHNYVDNYSVDGNNENAKAYYYVPLTYKKYDVDVRNVYVTESEKNIKLDGVPEDVYKNSSKAYKKDQYKVANEIQFESYSVATLDGLYVWVITNDSTLDNINDYNAETGDMIQIYFDWTLNYRSHDVNGYTGSAYKETYAYFCGGWFCFDYEGNIKQSLFKEAATLGQVDFKVIRYDKDADAWKKANCDTNYEKGYAVEVFIPWNDEIRDQIGSRANDIHMGLGIQVSDDANKNDGKEERTGIAYCASQTNETRFYYNNYEALPEVNFIYESTIPEYSRFVIDKVDDGKSVVIDGSNTAGEYDNALIIRADLDGRGTVDDGDIIRIIYDEKAIYMLIEVEDNTPSYDYNKFGKYADYVDLAIVFDNKYTTMTTFYRSNRGVDLINDNYYKDNVLKYGTAGHPTVNATGLRWYNYDAALDHFIDIDKSNAEGKTVYNSDYIASTNTPYYWSYEIVIPLTAEDYAKIQSGEFVFGVGAQYLDSYDTDGNYDEDNERNYKYTVKNSGIYTGDNAMNEIYHDNTAAHPSELYKYSYFKFKNVRESTVAGADVALGDSITMNFYVNAPEGADSVMAKIIMNDQLVLIEGEPAINTCGEDYMRQYVISFAGIAPQCVGDNINAKFYVDGKLIKTATKKLEEVNYSVLEYCQKVSRRSYTENKLKNEEQNTKLKSLVNDFLQYCAAAQNYVEYKTEDLVNNGYANIHDSKEAAPANKDKKIETATIDGAKFSALGIYHYSTNKIYAKVTVDTSKVDVAKLKVYINDSKVEAKMELSSQKGNEAVYIIYSDGIKVTGFDRVYKFVLTNGSQQQTLYYSINAYCNAKWGSATDKVKNLARTLYYYGIAAEAYQASLLNS